MVNDMLITKLDIIAEVGQNTAFTLEKIVSDINGVISIALIGLEENPKISGFEIIEVFDYVPPTASPTQTPDEVALINCGGPAYRDASGRMWLADSYSIGGTPYTDGNNDITGTSDDFLYHSERYGQFDYEIPLPSGTYDVILHFAELFWTQTGQRVFNVNIEGSADFPNVDIVDLGDGERLKPVSITSEGVHVIDGFLTITFTNAVPKIDNPKVSAIEVKRSSDTLRRLNGSY